MADSNPFEGQGQGQGPPPRPPPPQQPTYDQPPPPTQVPPDEAPPAYGNDDYGGMPPKNTDDIPAGEEPTQKDPSEDDPLTSDGSGYFGMRKRRLATMSGILLFFSLLSMARWMNSGDLEKDDEESAYQLEAAGIFFIFLATVAELVFVALQIFQEHWEDKLIYRIAVFAVLVLGGFLYWVGGIAYAAFLNDRQDNDNTDETNDYLGKVAGITFIEATMIGVFAVVLGVDVWRNYLSKSERIRIHLTYILLLLFCSLILLFCYAEITITDDNTIKGKDSDKVDEGSLDTDDLGTGASFYSYDGDSANAVAAGYFFILLSCSLLYVVEFVDLCCKCVPAAGLVVQTKKDLINIILCVLLLISALITAAGYWGIGDTGDSNFNAYCVGYGLFILLYCAMISLDVVFGKMIDEKFGGSSDKQ